MQACKDHNFLTVAKEPVKNEANAESLPWRCDFGAYDATPDLCGMIPHEVTSSDLQWKTARYKNATESDMSIGTG